MYILKKKTLKSEDSLKILIPGIYQASRPSQKTVNEGAVSK